ncbi:hypothetical protein [Thermoplasma sp.]|uniref:hypothetical protein n=1 Tax=Thermoplasma sp. TaxID=1973142 RepID=UPI001276407F|nr:hypothetical protein [Thermoplasma sp.]KAA8922407.1 MAG: hypothetical protein F6Q11_04745 [Thermoplasma sp.]
MKLKRFLILLTSVLAIVSIILLLSPLLEAYSLNSSLVDGAVCPGATYSYEMNALGPINFYRNNSVSNLLGNLGFTTSYINITMENGYAVFSVKLYGESSEENVTLADSFILKAGDHSRLFESFFPSGLGMEGEFVNVFNNTGQYYGTVSSFSAVNVGTATLYSTSQMVKLINVPGQPSGYYENLSRNFDANTVYYIESPSHSFLSYIVFTGNSTVFSALLGSSAVSNVTLIYISLEKTDVAVETLNISHYVMNYIAVVVILWILSVVYMVSLYRRVSLKQRR